MQNNVALYWADGQFFEYGTLTDLYLPAFALQRARDGSDRVVTFRRGDRQENGYVRFDEDPTVTDAVRV